MLNEYPKYLNRVWKRISEEGLYLDLLFIIDNKLSYLPYKDYDKDYDKYLIIISSNIEDKLNEFNNNYYSIFTKEEIKNIIDFFNKENKDKNLCLKILTKK